MKLYKILKTFDGSQTGVKTETFEEGTEVELTDYLVECLDEGTVELVEHADDSPENDAAATFPELLNAARKMLDGEELPAEEECKPVVEALDGEYTDAEAAMEFLENTIALAEADAIEKAKKLLSQEKQKAGEVEPLVLVLGGEYTNKPTGVEFLEEKIKESEPDE